VEGLVDIFSERFERFGVGVFDGGSRVEEVHQHVVLFDLVVEDRAHFVDLELFNERRIRF
jgi:hypothetical protein